MVGIWTAALVEPSPGGGEIIAAAASAELVCAAVWTWATSNPLQDAIDEAHNLKLKRDELTDWADEVDWLIRDALELGLPVLELELELDAILKDVDAVNDELDVALKKISDLTKGT